MIEDERPESNLARVGTLQDAVPTTPRPKTALEVAEERFKSYGLVSLNSTDLLLLDIARSLREQNEIAKAGLEWSKGLAHLLEGPGN